MDNIQGGATPDPSAIPSGQGGDGSLSAGISLDSSQLQVQPTVSDATQGAVQGNGQSGNEELRGLQSVVDRSRAEQQQLQYQLAQTQNQLSELMGKIQPQQQAPTNPYDPNSQPSEWWSWDRRAAINEAVSISEQRVQNQFMGLIQQASEQSWIQQHPNIDVNGIKAQIKMRYGVDKPSTQMIEDFHNFSQTGSQMQQVAQTASQQTAQNFRQPQTGATPIKPNGGMPVGQPTYKYEDLVRAVNERGEGVLNSLPKADQDEFWRVTQELNQRMKSGAPIY